MGFGDYNIQQGNGRKEKLGDIKHGIRREQIDAKLQNLFDTYDDNKDGCLEKSELDTIFQHLADFAGEDKTLDSVENGQINSQFKEKMNIENADFMGFVKSVSDASATILSSSEKQTPDGGKEVTTTYNDGTTETIAFYSNGDYKWKKTEKRTLETSFELIIDGKKHKFNDEAKFKKALEKAEQKNISNAMQNAQNKQKASQSTDGISKYIQLPVSKVHTNTYSKENIDRKESYSPRFIAETLGVNIATEDGKKVVERLSYLPQEALKKLKDGQELKELISSQELEPTFDNISNILEITEGVTLRNEEEYKATEVQRQEILTQIKAANFMANVYETLASYNDQYTDSVGLFGLGSEGIGYVLNKLGLDGENHYQFADSCREWAKNASELKVLNPQKFKEGFKKIYGKTADKYGIDYNSDAFKKCFALAESGKAYDKDNKMTDEYKEAILKAMNIVADDPNDSTFNQVMNGFGEALIMIATLGWGAETKAGTTLATTTMSTFSKAGVALASKQVNNKLLQGALRFSGQAIKLVGPALNEGTKMYLYTAAEGTLTNVSNRAIKQDGFDKLLDTQAQVMTNAESSFAFGAFAGVFGSTVTQKVMQRASKVASKVTTALSEKFSKGAVSANEVFATIMEKSAPTKIAEAAAFATDVIGFTAFESALSIANTLQREGSLTPEKLVNTLMEEFGHQGYSLGQIKVISHLIMMLTGSRSARMQSQKYLQENLPQLKGATLDWVNGGKDGFKINLPDGRRIECKNAAEMISSLHLMVRGETSFSGKFDKLNAAKGEGSKNDTSTKTEASPKQTTPQAAPQDKEVQGVRAEKSGKKAYEKPKIADIEDVLPVDIAQYLKSVAKNSILKKAGITSDVADKMRIETSGTYGSLLPSTLKMIEHFENKLAKGEKITPDDIYNAIQKFDSYWAEGGYGDKFQNLQRDLISKYWKNADKDFADKFNIAMTRTPEIMEFRTSVAQNSALKNGGITPDIATQMLRETSGTYGALVPRTLDMISYMQAKIESGAKLSSILVNEAFNKFNKEYTQVGYGDKFQNLQRDLISKYWKNAGENFGKIYDVAKNLDIDTPVQEIRTEYKNAFDDIEASIRAMGLDKFGKMSIRLKGQQSLHDKIANYLIDHPGATAEDAVKDVRDAIGARTVVESGNFKNHPEVKALLDAGKEREAMLRAAELQSEPAVKSFKAEILKQEQNKKHLVTARVSNYVSPDGIPYFSEAQLADLKQFAANHGIKLKINLRIDPSDPNFSKVDENYKPTTKSQPSGYTALQVNFTTKDGKTIEWQFRGDKVNEFAEGEHIPYDLRTGKNIIGEHKELEELYNPFIEMLSEKNMAKETYKEYNRYLGDYYTHLRKLELGFDSVEPKLEDYGKGFKFDERLSAKNLIALHEAADKIKNRVLSVKDAMEEYNSKISINRIEKFAGSVQPYTDLVVKNQEKIKELNKIQDMEEFCKQSFELIKNEMGLKDSGVKLAFAKGNEGGYYDLETNTVYANVNWNGTKCVEGQGNKAEIFGDIAHELTHHIQWIEIMRNGWFEDDLGSAYKQQLLKSKEGKYIYNYASKIGSNSNSFETSMNQLWNWLNYKEPYKKVQNGFTSDRNGNPIVDKNSLEYKEYKKQPVEKDAFEKGEAVVKKYKELID